MPFTDKLFRKRIKHIYETYEEDEDLSKYILNMGKIVVDYWLRVENKGSSDHPHGVDDWYV